MREGPHAPMLWKALCRGAFFRVSHNRAAAYEPLPATFPRRVVPVTGQSADGEREIVTRAALTTNFRPGCPATCNARLPKALVEEASSGECTCQGQ
jgi:hypothetical protein